VTEAIWSRGRGGDCIRLTGLPAGVDVRVFPGTAVKAGSLPPMAGRLERDGADLCFVPRFGFLDGMSYTVTVEGTRAAVLVRPRPERPAETEVTGIRPTADEVPVNLLRLYVWFSARMSEGYAAGQVRLARDDGSIIADALLPTEMNCGTLPAVGSPFCWIPPASSAACPATGRPGTRCARASRSS
jgi:hypothetical protein